MPAFVSLKNSLFMLLAGVLLSVGTALLLNYIFSGPKLGLHYDFLLNRKSPPVSRDILIIDTDEYIEGSDFFSALMTLTEMQSSKLILTGRMSPAMSPITITESEIRRRFIEEYQLAGSNIRNLFEGIRLGSVSPQQAPLFVERLVELTEQGRDRLITALVDRDEDMIRSVAVFGNFLDGYTRVQADADGKLRRVKPIDGDFEHPVYENLKERYALSQIETSGLNRILWLRGNDGKDIGINLDNDGNIIAMGGSLFRRLDIGLFREYEEKDRELLNLLAVSLEAGAFSKTSPERIPLFYGENALSLLNELLMSPDSGSRLAWVQARSDYYRYLNDFLKSGVDTLLINEYEERISDTDPANARELARLIGRRDELKELFESMNDIYAELSVIYEELKNELNASLCVMGPELNAEYSALIVNSLLTAKSHVKPVSRYYALFWSIAVSLIILLFVFMLRPFLILGIGSALSIISFIGFSGFFIMYSYWIDPIVVFASALTGTLAVFMCKSIYLNYRALSFRSAYKAAVPKNILQSLIDSGRPGLTEVNTAFAAVIAIKDINLFGREDNEGSLRLWDAGKIKRNFYTMAKRALFNAGAVIAGYEGDTIIACFGSPLELKPILAKYRKENGELIGTYHPVDKACALVRQLLENDKISWRFGIDAGECSFSWSPETGFSVSGRPAVRARILVSKTARYKKRALITGTVREKIESKGSPRKVGALHDETFYEFL
ncbi:MAG: hypothetical protein FWD28_04485 [Treponema sp.]|nr:hypothetical protein [Treponema sp.]